MEFNDMMCVGGQGDVLLTSTDSSAHVLREK